LNPFAWVQKVHEETLELKNLEVFRCYGWCYDLASIPHSRDLWITDSLGNGPGVGRLSLAYHVQTKVLDGQRVVPDPIQTPTDMDGYTRQRRRFRSRSPPGDRDGRKGSTEDDVLKGRRSALEHLGPRSEVQPREEGDASQCDQTTGNYEILEESSAVEITGGISTELAVVPNLAADRARLVLDSSPPHVCTSQPLAVSHALDVVVPRTPSEALLLPPDVAVMSTTARWGTMAPAPEHVQGPLAPVDELETVEQLVSSIDDAHADSSIPVVNLPLLPLEERGLGAAVVPDIVPVQGTPHPVDRPMFVEPQDVTIFSGGGLPSHL
jgi:hypothetical protein